MTAGWTVLVARVEVVGGEYEGVAETAIAVVSAAAPAAPLIVLYAILVISALELNAWCEIGDVTNPASQQKPGRDGLVAG